MAVRITEEFLADWRRYIKEQHDGGFQIVINVTPQWGKAFIKWPQPETVVAQKALVPNKQ